MGYPAQGQTASALSFAATGDLAADDVQEALAELDTEKLAVADNLSDVATAATAFSNIKQDATTAATGVVELATDAEAITGTSDTVVLTPGNLTAKLHASAATVTGSFTGFTTTETKTLNLTGLDGSNPVIRAIKLWISNDPGADTNINFRLSFYNADSMTEDELIVDFFFNLTYTETNGGVTATDTTDTVDDIGGLVIYDLIRFMGGTAENQRLTAAPSGTTLTFTAAGEAHADDTGIVRVCEIMEMFQLNDADASNEIHAKLETLSAPNASMNVYMEVNVQG